MNINRGDKMNVHHHDEMNVHHGDEMNVHCGDKINGHSGDKMNTNSDGIINIYKNTMTTSTNENVSSNVTLASIHHKSNIMITATCAFHSLFFKTH